MTKRALPLLTGGLNEIGRSDLIDNSQLQKCQNYEIDGDGTLARRTEPEQFDASLDVLLGTLYASVLYISEPWYPQALRSYSGETRSDYFLFAYGQDSSDDYKLHILWDKNGTWIEYIENDNGVDEELELSTLLTGVTYTSESEIEITIGTDKVIIADGVNRTHFVATDKDGNHRGGIMGIPAPTNKARVTEMTTWRADLWETDSTASRLSTPGLFQCIYTVVTKFGEESNPSPLSDTLDMQFFKLDEDGLDERWLEKVEIKDLSLPDVPDNVLDDLKYFKVYMRIIKYSEGESVATLEFSEQFEIVAKKDGSDNTLTSGTTGNDYTLTIEPTAGDVASWENDVAPIAKTGAEVGGITMLGNVKTKIGFPWEFKYYNPITINNTDAKSYVDAVIKIRLWDKDATGDDTNAIENFIVADFIYPALDIKREKHIRIFDQDLTTPIMVCYNGGNNGDDVNIDGDNHYMDLYIKIPLLAAASTHIVYLCWTPLDNETYYTGVPDAYSGTTDNDYTWSGNIGIHYGDFMVIGGHNWSRQQVWNRSRVSNSNNRVSTKLWLEQDGINVFNNNDNVTENNISWGEDSVDYIDSIGFILGEEKSVRVTDENHGYIKIDWWDSDNQISMPESGYVYIDNRHFLRLIHSELFSVTVKDSDGDIPNAYYTKMVVSAYGTEDNPTYKIRPYINGYNWEPELIVSSGGTGNRKYFKLIFSWDKDKFSVLLKVKGEEIQTYIKEFDDDLEIISGNLSGLCYGAVSSADVSPAQSHLGNLDLVINKYIDPNSNDDMDMVNNIFNFMPAFDEIIGYKYSDTSHNNNIVFGETKEIKFKEYKGMVKWTDVNYSSFPDLFYKRVREPVLKIMSAPSFLQFEYQNTFIIFTRNSINRFVLEGSADGWSGSSNAMIEEKTQYGLLAPESLVRAGDALFWLSEVGVMMWTSEGLRLISKDIVDIPIEEDVIGFYNNLKNQYVLHRNIIGQEGTNQSITYIFQIDRNAWSKYTGLDIVSASGLTGGSQLDNINLFLDSDGAITKYPTSSTTSVESLIQTKEMFFEKGTLRRIKAGFEGDDVDFTSHMKKNDGNGSEITKTNTINSIEPNKWRGISLANSRGKAVSFEVKNADKIEKIMYDLKIESEVVV